MKRSISNITSDPLELYAQPTGVIQSNNFSHSFDRLQSATYKQVCKGCKEQKIYLQEVHLRVVRKQYSTAMTES
ncbi:hypothetical protein HCG92_02050 [Bacteroides cellulosilyticus]|uniref:hypothetical protein n=1 Tax=Bacteroides cellulosilyticus TaxID=246787 RepID=UPI001C8C9FF8|nr:hypothetical protein [Bacteroides cellulosilyticus]MBX9084004.1 hypothetical protein [Bacteroides cellulosilyticus]